MRKAYSTITSQEHKIILRKQLLENLSIVDPISECLKEYKLHFPLDLDDFETSRRSTIIAEEGNTVLIHCKLPKSNPDAQARFRIRGKWLEQSTGENICKRNICVH